MKQLGKQVQKIVVEHCECSLMKQTLDFYEIPCHCVQSYILIWYLYPYNTIRIVTLFIV